MLVTLNAEFIANQLVCPPGKTRFEYVDKDGVRGLYVEARPKKNSPSEGTFYLRFKDAYGKTCHQRLGGTRDMSLAEARTAAKKLKAQITLGADPRAEAKAKKAVITFGELITDHYWSYVKPRKRSWKRDEQLYRLRIKGVFGQKRLNAITRQEIQLFHTALAGEGLAPATADHHIKLIRRVLNLAVEWSMLEKNPAARIPLFNRDNRVEHLMSKQQLQNLVEVLRADNKHKMVCSIVLFLALTGLRRAEALGLSWRDLDLERRILTIQTDRSKNKTMRHIPLADGVLEILRDVGTKDEYEHVFVNRRTGRPYVEITRVWHVLRNRAGLPHLRLHDLRHQVASMLLEEGYSARAVQQWLGHRSLVTTERYLHVQDSVMRNAAGSVSQRILGKPIELGSAGQPDLVTTSISAAMSGGAKSAA